MCYLPGDPQLVKLHRNEQVQLQVSVLNLACLDVYWGLFIFTKVIRLIGIRQIYFVPIFWNFRYNEQGS